MRKCNYLAMCFTALVAACGGGGGGGASNSTTSSLQTFTSQYIDAPIKGLSYVAAPSGMRGTTDANGSFNFQSGDTVTFKILRANDTWDSGGVEVGQLKPDAPTTGTQAAPISVVSVEGGQMLAQIFQTLGGTGASIDLTTNTAQSAINSLTSQQITAVANYVRSGGVTPQPQFLTVTKEAALLNAMGSIGQISNQQPSRVQIINALSDKTFIFNDVLSIPTQTFAYKISDAAFVNFKGDGTYSTMSMCGKVLENRGNEQIQVVCDSGISVNDGTWAINNNGQLVISVNGGAVLTASIYTLDSNMINFSGSYAPTLGGQYGTMLATMEGVNSSLLSGKTVTVSGESYCSADGKMSFVFSGDGSTFRSYCTATPSTTVISSGAVTYPQALPNTLKLSWQGGERYLAFTKGSSVNSGKAVTIMQGDTRCYTNATYCGTVSTVAYTVQ